MNDASAAPDGPATGLGSVRSLCLARQSGGCGRPGFGPNNAAKSFAQAHAGSLGSLSGAALAAVIAEYERIQEMLGRVASYAQLLFAGDSTDPAIGRFYQTVNERVTGDQQRPDLLHAGAEPDRRRGAGGQVR